MTPYEGIPIVDTHIGFREAGYDEYAFITRQTKDRESNDEFTMPAQYMFKGVPDLAPDDPISVTLHEMDKHGIEIGMVSMAKESGQRAVRMFPDRFVTLDASVSPDELAEQAWLLVSELLGGK